MATSAEGMPTTQQFLASVLATEDPGGMKAFWQPGSLPCKATFGQEISFYQSDQKQVYKATCMQKETENKIVTQSKHNKKKTVAFHKPTSTCRTSMIQVNIQMELQRPQ